MAGIFAVEEPMTTDPKNVVSIEEAAEMIGVARQYVSRMIQSGRLTAVPVGHMKGVDVSSIRRFKKARKQGVTRSPKAIT